MVEGCVQIGIIDPRVGESCTIRVGQRELPTSPEVLIERVVEYLQEAGIYVGEKVFFTPLQAIGMFAGGVSGMERFLLLTGAPVPIILLIRTPVEGASDNVISTGGIAVVVASGLGNVDFARFGPRSKCVVDGQHPDGGPKPITLWHCGHNFDTTILDGCTFKTVDAAGFNWGNNGTVRDVGSSVAVVVLG